MKITIEYERFANRIDATARLIPGVYACASGKSLEEARTNLIARAIERKKEIQEPIPAEEVEI